MEPSIAFIVVAIVVCGGVVGGSSGYGSFKIFFYQTSS